MSRPTTRSSLGHQGEDLAATFLRRAGYRVEARNLRTRVGEIDILARRRRLWVAVEVKTRTRHPAPERTVSEEQLQRLQQALFALAPSLRPRPRALRVDVLAVRLQADGTSELRQFQGPELDPHP